ncbi:MAG: aminotransferase class I and II [Bacteroidetes bacterium]|nr:aminotransferase class I and II [Bacteroidota bacterium]
MPGLRHVKITRYLMALREGGSLPGLAEADDGFKYVVKFRGNGHGPKALIAELIGGEMARALGLRVPELVFAELDPAFGRTEPDEEIQELLQKSSGLNVGLHFLAGAITFDPAVTNPDPLEASLVVWLDSFLTNIDRTARNTNLLYWRKDLWLIDHGSCLYFHYAWDHWERHATGPFPQVKDHVLLLYATRLHEAEALARERLLPAILDGIVDLVPDALARQPDSNMEPDHVRAVYKRFLHLRMGHSSTLTTEAANAREAFV